MKFVANMVSIVKDVHRNIVFQPFPMPDYQDLLLCKKNDENMYVA